MTNHASPTETDDDSPGSAALRAAIGEHGEEIAAVIERSDQVSDLIDTIVLVLASAEDEDVEHVADAISSLVRATDAASTEEAVALAEFVGENGEDATSALGKLLELERAGTLDDLLELGTTLTELDLDDGSVGTLNRLLAALEEAEREAEPTGFLGAIRSLGDRDAKAGLGVIVSLLKSLGRNLVDR